MKEERNVKRIVGLAFEFSEAANELDKEYLAELEMLNA